MRTAFHPAPLGLFASLLAFTPLAAQGPEADPRSMFWKVALQLSRGVTTGPRPRRCSGCALATS